jgi:DNA-directed RNA polymerase subunit RPC12/RpoP
MADFKFTCSHCGQEIECDELWSGHEIQCPTCKGQLVVPPKPDAPPHASLASVKRDQPKLSIGHSRSERSAAPPPPPPQALLLEQKLNQARAGKKGNAKKWVTIGAVVVIVGVGGCFAYGPVSGWWAKRGEAGKQSSKTATQEVAAAAAEAAPAAPATPAPEKELPVLAPAWTLDLDKAKIPESRVNGSISGTNFVAETAMCTAQVLRLSQGASASPDREILVYLHLNPGQSPTGHTWTVSQEMKDRNVPQVVKRWKTNPKYAPLSKPFSSGYAMKLELGQITNGVIPGKIFVALPDAEQSVVAGSFKAVTSLADASGAAVASPVVNPAASPVAAPNPGLMPGGPPSAGRSAFDRRYGTKR